MIRVKVYCGQDQLVATAINTENTHKDTTVFFLSLHHIVHFCIDLDNLYAIYSQLHSVRFVIIYLIMNSKHGFCRDG